MTEQAIKNIIPEDWGYDRLWNLCRVFSGYAFKSEDFVSSGIVVIKIGNLQNGTLVIDNRTTYFPENKVSGRHQRFVLHKDDVLIALTGATTGKIAVVPPSFDGALLNQRVGKFEINRDKLNQLFFRFYALTGSFQKEIKDNILQSAQGNVSPQKIESFEILIPRVWEQRKITYVLYELHRAIAQQEKIITKTKELKRALMHRLFTYGMRGEELKETEIGLMPKSWEPMSISDISDKLIGGGTPSTKIPQYWNGNIEWTTSKRLGENIYLYDGEKKISENGLNNSSTNLIPKDNLLISTRVTVGKAVVNKTDIAISQDLTGMIINKDRYSAEFIVYQFKIGRIQKIFEEQKRGATIKGITREDLKKIKLGIPDIKEQKEITNILSNVDKKIQQAETRMQGFQALFKSMLQLLMTGQVRVKDIDFGDYL